MVTQKEASPRGGQEGGRFRRNLQGERRTFCNRRKPHREWGKVGRLCLLEWNGAANSGGNREAISSQE